MQKFKFPFKHIRTGLTLFALLINFFVFAQEPSALGVYTIRNYSAKAYRMHPRNTYITQDQRGVVHFGNIYGTMDFDGNYWENTHLPNGTSGFSLSLGHDKKMYVGSHNELGFLSYNAIGQNKYKSLLPLIPQADRNMGSIWEIIPLSDVTLFFSTDKIFVYKNGAFTTIQPIDKNAHFQFAKKIDQTLYINESNRGLLTLENNILKTIAGGAHFKNHVIKALIKLDQHRLLVLEEKNSYLLNDGMLTTFSEVLNNTVFKTHDCSHAIQLANKNILITTLDNGFYIVNTKGQVLKNITIDNGLQSNCIHYAYLDNKNNVWLALDNGIAYLEINSPFTFIGHSNGVPGMGFSSALFNDNLYLATSQGVFYTPWNATASKGTFKPVVGITGQVWSLSIVDNTLLCCQGPNSFQIEEDRAIALIGSSNAYDSWTFQALKAHPGFAIKGTYQGFELYQLENKRWKFIRKIKGFEESSRIVVEDQYNNIWVCHGNKGLYKLRLSEDLQRIEKAENLSALQHFSSDFFIGVSIVNQHVVFASQEGVYTVHEQTNKIIKDIALEKLFGTNLYINKIQQFDDGNIWLFQEDNISLFQKTNEGGYTSVTDVLHKLTGSLVGSYEFVLPINEEYSIIGSQEGFVLFNLNNKHAQHNPYQVLVRKVEANFQNDSLLFGGTLSNAEGIASIKQETISHWPYGFNSLRISFSALFYESNDKITYQYALAHEHSKKVDWSGWTSTTQIVLSNLSEGTYTFHVRAKNIYGQLSDDGQYSFTINPPWYRSIYAYLIYLMFLAAGFIVLVKLIRKRFHAQRQKLELEKEKELKLLEQEFLTEIIRKEKQIIAIKNEQLEEKVVRKQNELASLATNLNQKTELLVYLKEKFKNIDSEPAQPGDKLFKEVIKTIDQQFDVEDNWSKFQAHFDEIHHNFLQRLQEKHPKLDQSWLLLCAYIRMNKSNKEIASHMNISVAAVEKRRYRLKEKLELDNDSKLVDFILTF